MAGVGKKPKIQAGARSCFPSPSRHLASAHPLPNLPAPVQAGQCRSSPGALWEAILCNSSVQHPSQTTTSGRPRAGWGGALGTATHPSVACPDALGPPRGSAPLFSGVGVPSSLSQMCGNTQNGVSVLLWRMRLARMAGRCGKDGRPSHVRVWANLWSKHPRLPRGLLERRNSCRWKLTCTCCHL